MTLEISRDYNVLCPIIETIELVNDIIYIRYSNGETIEVNTIDLLDID
jgi:hypothetical protein